MADKDDGQPKAPKEMQSYVAFYCPTDLLFRFDTATGAITQRGVRAKVLRHIVEKYTAEQEALARKPREKV